MSTQQPTYNPNSPISHLPYSMGPPYSPNYPAMQPPASTLTRSRIMEQNRYPQNEPLYSPLKNAVGSDMERIKYKQYDYINAAGHSHISTEYRPISTQQVRDIRDNTYMIDQPLKPTNHLDKVEGKHFYVLDSHQKIGTPINEIQLVQRLAASREREQNIVIYEPEGSPEKAPVKPIKLAATGPANQKNKLENAPAKKKNQGKYNLYSFLDEPFERVKNYGCKGFTCPANQCVAATEKPDWLN